jgi:hypothetical protein
VFMVLPLWGSQARAFSTALYRDLTAPREGVLHNAARKTDYDPFRRLLGSFRTARENFEPLPAQRGGTHVTAAERLCGARSVGTRRGSALGDQNG